MSARGKVCVVGLGYIGLPTASVLATSGYEVVGCDVDGRKLSLLKEGKLPIYEPGLRTVFEAGFHSGRLTFSREPVEGVDAYIICVPTPLTENLKPDLTYLKKAAEDVVKVLSPGSLIVVESTVYPGATEEVFLPLLRKRHIEPGKDVFLAHCPERVIPGKIIKEIIENDRVIGGYTKRCGEKAREVYSSFVEGEIFITNLRTAEMVKLAENTFRMVNISLSMELARIGEEVGVNVWEVINLANHHPRVNLHLPGPGMGGHCLPVDPYFFLHIYPGSKVIKSALDVNREMMEHSALRAFDLAGKGAKVSIMGVAYKGDVDDDRESPGYYIGKMLEKMGCRVAYHDPLVNAPGVEKSLEKAVEGSGLLVFVTDHTFYRELNPEKVAGAVKEKIVLDLRNVLLHERWERSGFRVEVLGTPRGRGK